MPFTKGALDVTVQKVGATPAGYEYLVISGKDDKKMEVAFNDAAAKGFRVVPGAAATQSGAFGQETVVLLEKSLAGTATPVRYRVIGATRLFTFTKELDEAKQEGGELVGIIGSGDRHVAGPHVAILERPAAK